MCMCCANYAIEVVTYLKTLFLSKRDNFWMFRVCDFGRAFELGSYRLVLKLAIRENNFPPWFSMQV